LSQPHLTHGVARMTRLAWGQILTQQLQQVAIIMLALLLDLVANTLRPEVLCTILIAVLLIGRSTTKMLQSLLCGLSSYNTHFIASLSRKPLIGQPQIIRPQIRFSRFLRLIDRMKLVVLQGRLTQQLILSSQ
jgi:hypothetical protein